MRGLKLRTGVVLFALGAMGIKVTNLEAHIISEEKNSEAATPCESTLLFYENNAKDYSARTREVNLDRAYDRFLRNVPPRGRVMDLGVGSGRDSKVFVDRGLQVFPVETSPAMAEEAQKLIKQPVHIAKMQHLSIPQESLDGVWASASMLHLNARDFVQTLRMALVSLRAGGIFYLSLKTNPITQEYTDKDGRFFTLWNKREVLRLIEASTGFRIVEDWDSPDADGRANTLWTNFVLKKN